MREHGTAAALAAITALAAGLRFFRLEQLPPGFHFDLAFNAFDGLRLLEGQFAVFFPANTGREPLYIYLSTVTVALFGPTAYAYKFLSAVIGVATIPLIFAAARSLFSSTRIGLLAASFAAISFWHVYFSRDGLRVILEVPLTLLVFWYAWRAFDLGAPPRAPRSGTRRDFCWTGFYLALGLYTYPSARLLPLALLLLTVLAFSRDPARRRDRVGGLLLALAVAGLLVSPLAFYFALHPDQFISHTFQVSIFADSSGAASLSALVANGRRLLGMFLFAGDSGLIRNLSGRPVFDPLAGVAFLAGAGLLLAGLLGRGPGDSSSNRARSFFFAIWIGISLVSSLFSDDAPNFLRTLPALPALMMLPAWALGALWNRSPRAWALATVILIASGLLTARDYFVTFAGRPEAYRVFNGDMVDIASWINANAGSDRIFLAPLYYQQGTISLLTRTARLKTFDSRDSIVLPAQSGQDAVFAFPPEQEKRAQTIADRLGSMGERRDLRGADGGLLLRLYQVPADRLPALDDPLAALRRGGEWVVPQQALNVDWPAGIRLFGYSAAVNASGPRSPTVMLFLQARQPLRKDYTFSIKIRDGQGRTWGQEDKFPGDNSYPTSSWSPGDVIIERFSPDLDPCAPAGRYELTAEAYEPSSMEILPAVGRDKGPVAIGQIVLGPPGGVPLANLQPKRASQIVIGDGMRTAGWTLSNDSVLAGGTFSVAVYWQGAGEQATTTHLSLQMRDAGGGFWTLAEREVRIPPAGRGVCDWYDLQVPPGAGAGIAALQANGVHFASIQIVSKGK